MDIAQIIQTATVNALPLLFAITVHEAAHGYAAKRFGDNTAHLLGRITLNPLKHIDPVGTIAMPLLLFVLSSGAFALGYAKPVPVDFGQLRNPKRDMIWVALAGPGANLIQAFVWAAIAVALNATELNEPFFSLMAVAGIKWNLLLFAFNLFPLPPLDGGRILVGLLPWKQAQFVSRVEPYGIFIVLALTYYGVVANLWLLPLASLAFNAIQLLLTPLRMLIL
jgi:Zn-dependent protease